MKVVYINTFGHYGGAAIAALRSLEAVRSIGVDAQLLAGFRVQQEDNYVHNLWSGRELWKKAVMSAEILSYLRHAADKKNKFVFSPALFGLPVARQPLVRQADVIHLHWTHQGLLSLRGMEKNFSMGKPVVITLHDRWYMTGGCYYPMGCPSYNNECKNCPLLIKGSHLAHKRLIEKKRLFKRFDNIHLIAISQWMKNNILDSQVLGQLPIHHIPNAINIELFKPQNKQEAKAQLNLDTKKKYIGFVAVNVDDTRKGAKYLYEALSMIAQNLDPEKYALLIIGRHEQELLPNIKLQTIATGFIPPSTMPDYYNAMDVFVLPSLVDNLPNSVMEALACGVPVVGFDIGGVPDMVIHQRNGYLAHAKDSTDLAQGIEWILEKSDYPTLSTQARNFVVNNFSYETIGKKLHELYENLL